MPSFRAIFDAAVEHPLRLLLWMMLVVFAVRPAIESFPIVFALDALFSLTLLGVLHRLVQSGPVFWGSVTLLSLALVARAADHYDDTPWLTLASDIISATLTLTVLLVLLDYVLRAPRVTHNTLLASICVYVLLGVFWGFVYLLIYRGQPHAFDLDPNLGQPEQQLRYFSMITLTTVGYGDIVPKSAEARAVSAIQALLAQIYLAAIVARLVGIEVANAAKSQDTPPPGTGGTSAG